MRFGSVCSGIEAASVAGAPLGWKAAWLAEIEKFPAAVLAHHYPEVPNLGDMTKLPERIRSGEVDAPDVFCGGTPCFPAGHMVLTASGYRAIESLAPGEEVMTHKGRMRQRLHSRPTCRAHSARARWTLRQAWVRRTLRRWRTQFKQAPCASTH